MKIQQVNLKQLPKTSILDGTPLYNNPVGLIRKFYLQRIELCMNLLEAKDGNALDVGCGSGILLPTLTQMNGLIVGVDNHNYLSRVNNYLKKNHFHNISLIKADTHQLPFRKSVFNSILIISLLDHLNNPRLAIHKLRNVSISNGTIIFGFHVNNIFYSITIFLWSILQVISHLILFKNFKEVVTNLFKPNSWRHVYSNKVLMKMISEKLRIKEMIYLRVIRSVYVAIRSVKKK